MGDLYASWPSFLVVTVALGGAAAYASGRASALSWSPAWLLVPLALALAAVARFLHFALFGDALLGLPPFLIDLVVVAVAALLGRRVARARQMTRRYPFAFERTGPLGWREKGQESPESAA